MVQVDKNPPSIRIKYSTKKSFEKQVLQTQGKIGKKFTQDTFIRILLKVFENSTEQVIKDACEKIEMEDSE